jgi:hypothetical protein
MDGPEAEYGLVARLSELARKLTAAWSTGKLDDATGCIDDVPRRGAWWVLIAVRSTFLWKRTALCDWSTGEGA